jgi:hypothetical protein
MDSWRIVILLTCLLCAGCRAGRLTEPLERENRHLEDALYHLEDQLHELHAQLDSCRRENAALRKQMGTASSGDLTAPPRTELGEQTRQLPQPDQPREELEAAPPYQGPPTIAPPDPSQPEGIMSDDSTIETTPPVEQPTGKPLPADDSATHGADAAVEDFDVAEITLNQQLTGGHDRDNRPGDDGIMVVVEPRNHKRQLIEVPGEVSIVVLDPALEGVEARVARWDFDSRECAEHFKNTALGSGAHFALPWPAGPPRHADLRLFVRFTPAGGQQFVVDKAIRVKLPSDVEPSVQADEQSARAAGQTSGWQASSGRFERGSGVDDKAHAAAAAAMSPDAWSRSARRPQWSPGR